MLHLDIKPENIYLRKDGSPMLIDFGSTRQAISQTMPDKFLVTHGYAPIEQYPDKGKQGPWTDLYALGASMYRCISGKRPVNALERYQAVLHYQTDPLTPATVIGKSDYSLQLLGCIDWALQVHPRDRPQSARVFQDRLLGSHDLGPDHGIADCDGSHINVHVRPCPGDSRSAKKTATGPTIEPGFGRSVAIDDRRRQRLFLVRTRCWTAFNRTFVTGTGDDARRGAVHARRGRCGDRSGTRRHDGGADAASKSAWPYRCGFIAGVLAR